MAAVGLAYSTCILCFEGSKAFEPALLAYIEEVALLGKRSGVGLSVLTTTSPEETEVLPPFQHFPGQKVPHCESLTCMPQNRWPSHPEYKSVH
jgi:hypothetical protein